MDLTTRLGPLTLRSPLVAASGTVGSVVDFAAVGRLRALRGGGGQVGQRGPLAGPAAPRLYPVGSGMLNGIGIQNPGIAAWLETMAPRLPAAGVPVWGSVVGRTAAEFARVAAAMSGCGRGGHRGEPVLPEPGGRGDLRPGPGRGGRGGGGGAGGHGAARGGQALAQRRRHRRGGGGGGRRRGRLRGGGQHRVGGGHRPGDPAARALGGDRGLLGGADQADRPAGRARSAPGPARPADRGLRRGAARRRRGRVPAGRGAGGGAGDDPLRRPAGGAGDRPRPAALRAAARGGPGGRPRGSMGGRGEQSLARGPRPAHAPRRRCAWRACWRGRWPASRWASACCTGPGPAWWGPWPGWARCSPTPSCTTSPARCRRRRGGWGSTGRAG